MTQLDLYEPDGDVVHFDKSNESHIRNMLKDCIRTLSGERERLARDHGEHSTAIDSAEKMLYEAMTHLD